VTNVTPGLKGADLNFRAIRHGRRHLSIFTDYDPLMTTDSILMTDTCFYTIVHEASERVTKLQSMRFFCGRERVDIWQPLQASRARGGASTCLSSRHSHLRRVARNLKLVSLSPEGHVRHVGVTLLRQWR